jgi:hypothetical protein
LPTIDDNQNYTNAAFEAARASGMQTYKNSEASWREQREMVSRVGFSYLAEHPLVTNLTAALSE